MIYVASPYSHPDREVMSDRYKKAVEFTAYGINYGFHVFSTIVHNHPCALAVEMAKDSGFWWEYNKEMIGKCNAMVVLELPGWDSSKGVKQELEYWKELTRKFPIPCEVDPHLEFHTTCLEFWKEIF